MKSGIEQGHQKKHPFQGNRKATTIPVHVLYWYAGISMSLEDQFCRTININSVTYLTYHRIVFCLVFLIMLWCSYAVFMIAKRTCDMCVIEDHMSHSSRIM